MVIHQFYDTGLAHGSYAIIRGGKMIVIDPGRDPKPYYDFAILHEADIVGVIETHPHADFVSSHLEIHQSTGATIYVSKLLGAEYPHETFDDGDIIALSDIRLKAINTPGHSPDSICILVEDENGEKTSVFTGDTLFVGDVGRPDLRENAGNITAQKEELARQMYHSTREKLMTLPHHIAVYPAHGPGSLCGKNMSPDLDSTIGRELRENYALQLMDELQFVKMLTTDQPFVPKYFGHAVEVNKKGAAAFSQSVTTVPKSNSKTKLKRGITVVDTRPEHIFKNRHISGAINIQDGSKFETWLGSIIAPDEKFYLIAADKESLQTVIEKTAKIGYEHNIVSALVAGQDQTSKLYPFNTEDFRLKPSAYTIVDVRNEGEVKEGLIFNNAIAIPLPELRERLDELPTDKPIVVHCAAGYRSAAGSSIVAAKIDRVSVYDFGERITEFIS